MRATLVTTILAALVATAASAEELRPIEAKSISLGDVSGIAYYTVQPDGYEVVATLATAETATPVRFVATLTPGQRVTLSVPAGPGAPEVRVDISRVGDRLEFGPGAQVAVIN